MQSTIRIEFEMFEMIEKLRDTDLSILIFLYKNGPSSISKIVKENRMSYGTVYRAKDILREFGLIKAEKIGNVHILALTDFGQWFVDQLLLLDQKLRETYRKIHGRDYEE